MQNKAPQMVDENLCVANFTVTVAWLSCMSMWYVLVNQDQLGPMGPDAIADLYEQGVIAHDTLVWRDGFSDWFPLDRVGEFAHIVSVSLSSMESEDEEGTLVGDPATIGLLLEGVFPDETSPKPSDEPPPGARAAALLKKTNDADTPTSRRKATAEETILSFDDALSDILEDSSLDGIPHVHMGSTQTPSPTLDGEPNTVAMAVTDSRTIEHHDQSNVRQSGAVASSASAVHARQTVKEPSVSPVPGDVVDPVSRPVEERQTGAIQAM